MERRAPRLDPEQAMNHPPPTAWCFACRSHVPLHRRVLWIRIDPHHFKGVLCPGSLEPIRKLDGVSAMMVTGSP
jgi:hypothetical protein